MKNEEQRSATVPMGLFRQPGADHPALSARGIIFRLIFMAADRACAKLGTHSGPCRNRWRAVSKILFTQNDMRRRVKLKRRIERMCIAYTSAGENPGKLSDENKTKLDFDLVCQTHLTPDDFRHNEPLENEC
jgi:hypothetical protein